MEGIIYLYESPSGKFYVGQTFKENKRRNAFLNNVKYAGIKIDRARLKYGAINFKYTVLFRENFSSYEEGYPILDKLESYYINKYDSYVNGYNMTLGGSKDFRGHKASKEFKENCRINNPFKNHKHSVDTKQIISDKNTKYSVIMLDKDTEKELAEFKNATYACKYLGISSKCRNDIYKVCTGYVNPKYIYLGIALSRVKWEVSYIIR